jgi:aldehyde:ferredoxin oxidoreductase
MSELFGYAGRILRVDLNSAKLHDEPLDETTARQWVGGVGLGAKYLCEGVSPDASWSDPANRLIWASGPLGGTRSSGSGTIALVTKGAMTNMAASTQANGFFGAFLKSCGYDAVIFDGASPDWVYLYIDDNGAELRDARFLTGMDTWEIEDAVVKANGGRKCSVFGIGPAGENMVRFAAVAGDRGHVAAHNGVGAVMGSKKLKAVAVARGKRAVPVPEQDKFNAVAKRAAAKARENDPELCQWGTGPAVNQMYAIGGLPVKNYTTNIFAEHDLIDATYTRTRFTHKKTPCWACQIGCSQLMTVTEGPYAGFTGDEPEYEGITVCSAVIGQADPGTAVMLANQIDRLGLDINESGWVMGLAMECYEKGLLTKADTGGLELHWGNAEAALALMRQVAHREGLGQVFADGVRVAVERIGGEAPSLGVYTLKGNTPRTHDHRAVWCELIDTCFSNTGTIEVAGGTVHPSEIGLDPIADQFSWDQVSTMNAKYSGRRQWTDTLGACRFNFATLSDEVETVNAATGWDLTVDDAMVIGKRIVNQLRMFNIGCGLTPEIEAPSPKYGSAPVDGPVAGKSILDNWDALRRNYYRQMGWNEETGRPLPETLEALGLSDLPPDPIAE